MNIRDAILAAADHIEANPREFNFASVRIPKGAGCGTPGCALGWIGSFAGMTINGPIQAASEVLGLHHRNGWDHAAVFYSRMDDICQNCGWKHDSSICADTMRLYADKYHPATTPSVELGTWQEVAKLYGYAPKAVA